MPLLKKYVVIFEGDGVPLFVSPIIEGDNDSYLRAKKAANANLRAFKKFRDDTIKELKSQIAELQKEVAHLKGED